MRAWQGEITIHSPIDIVWQLIYGSPENLTLINPKIVSIQTLCETPEVIGSQYSQTCQEGNKTIEYIVTVIDYENDKDQKQLTLGYNIKGRFDITDAYALNKMEENKTHLVYRTTCQAVYPIFRWMTPFIRANLFISGHLNLIKQVSELK